VRIELDDESVAVLDQIRSDNWRVRGRGHSDTVRFLARYYLEHKSVEDLLREHRDQIPGIIEKAFGRAMQRALVNLFAKVQGPNSV